jgi:hypothetical protein
MSAFSDVWTMIALIFEWEACLEAQVSPCLPSQFPILRLGGETASRDS